MRFYRRCSKPSAHSHSLIYSAGSAPPAVMTGIQYNEYSGCGFTSKNDPNYAEQICVCVCVTLPENHFVCALYAFFIDKSPAGGRSVWDTLTQTRAQQ